MTMLGFIVFAGALFVAAATPGPGVAALLARVLARGQAGAAAFTAGLMFGDVVWLGVATLGLAALAQSFAGLFLAAKYTGAAYLLYLAWKLWTGPATPSELSAVAIPREHPVRLFLAGLLVTLGNPKCMVFYLALLPTILDMGSIGALQFSELAMTVLAVLTTVFGAYIVLAVRARRLFSSATALRRINRTTGAVMAGAAVAVAAR